MVVILKYEQKLLQPKPDSLESGLCATCTHLVGGLCDTKRPCGQVLACRSQERALVFGRFPSGRVRQTPPKRVGGKKDGLKPSAWKETRERLKNIGDECGCVWIQFLSNSQQVSVRRFIKSGRMTAVHVDGALIRGVPALFVSKAELDENFKTWEARYGS